MLDTYPILKTYTDRRLAKVLLIGVISGLPWVFFGAMMSLWLKDEGFSRSAIGLFGYVATIYALNFLWAPLLDSVRIPYLSKWVGNRRAWIIAMQAIIISCVIALYYSSLTATGVWGAAILCLIIASASATQDIAIDAMRIELMEKSEQALVAAGAAMAAAGWYTGYNLGGASALYLADWFKHIGLDNPWQTTYLLMALLIVITNIALLFSKENPAGRVYKPPLSTPPGSSTIRSIATHVKETFWMPFYEFFQRNGKQTALLLLGFIVLFKIGEAFLGRMSIIFYKEVGFSEADIATYSKLLGWWVIIIFSILGSFFSIRYGLFLGLIICGIAMAATNLMFAWLAVVGANTTLFAAAVVIDQFTTTISTIAFVAFISQLCNRAYTATQYALMASLGNLSRTTLAAHSGQLVDALSGAWHIFFVLTSFMVIPSLLLLWTLRKRFSFQVS